MLQDPFYSVMLFVILCASAGLGFFIHPRLPERHRSPQSIALLQLAIGLLVTFTAIVLALLTTSVKAGFDQAYNARGEYAGKLAALDRCLRDYGPETAHIDWIHRLGKGRGKAGDRQSGGPGWHAIHLDGKARWARAIYNRGQK